jgi:hypothetical protein
VDISSVLFGGTRKALTAEIAFSGLKASAFVSTTPTMEISWKGDPLEMCTRTVVVSDCPSEYVPIEFGVVGVLSTAETGGAASVSVARAFDYITSATCASPKLSIETKIAGQRSTDPNAPADIPSGTLLDIVYTVTNGGSTALLNPVLTDEGTAPGPNDNPFIGLPIGDNGDHILRSHHSWTFKGTARPLPQQDFNQLHPVLTGTPIDGNGVPAGTLPVTEDQVFYFLSKPVLTMSAGIYEGHNGGDGCPGKDKFYAPPATLLLTYCYVVTNAGNVALTNITVDDLKLGLTTAKLKGQTGSIALLPVGASITLYFETANVADGTTTATATGTSLTGVKVIATADTELGPRQLPAT